MASITAIEDPDLDESLASRSFVDFLDFVYIQEPPQPLVGIEGGRVPFQKWEYIMDLAYVLETELKVCVLKARQLGFSWLVSAYAAWFLTFKPGTVVLMLSRGEIEAWALLKKVRFIYTNLPKSWQRPLDSDGRGELAISFDDGVLSKIMALPSTEDAGRSETASVVIADESDFHLYAEQNYLALQPTIGAGGQMIIGSTSNKRKMDSIFKKTYRGAPDNHWHKTFWGWKLRPDRTDDWYRITRETTPIEEMDGLGADFFMEQEYPGTEEEALKPARSTSYFDMDILSAMSDSALVPLPVVVDDYYSKNLNFYVLRTPLGRYAAGTDIAAGLGRGDYSVTVIVDLHSTPNAVVADVMLNNMQPIEFIEESIALLKEYRSPMWGIERNSLGEGAVNAAIDQGYPLNKLYYQEMFTTTRNPTIGGPQSGNRKTYGWYTTLNSRKAMWMNLQHEVNTRQLNITSKKGLEQFFSIIDDEKPVALGSAFDDYPTAVAIALQVGKKVPNRSKGIVTVRSTWGL